MAIFKIVEGQPGQGKSLHTARTVTRLLRRNKKWYEKQLAQYELKLASWERSRELRSVGDTLTLDADYELANPRPIPPVRRRILSNIKFSEEFEERWGGIFSKENPDAWISYWSNLSELHDARHVDIIWDEIATELDSRNWPNLSPETMRMLSQYRKRGLDIYANTQDFSMVDARARLMITSVDTLKKLIGSPDPSATKPEVKRVWGVILVRGVENWKEVDMTKKRYNMFNWSLMLIEREYVDMYDTTQDIPVGAYPPMRHIERYCELGEACTDKGHHRVQHV